MLKHIHLTLQKIKLDLMKVAKWTYANIEGLQKKNECKFIKIENEKSEIKLSGISFKGKRGWKVQEPNLRLLGKTSHSN